jgi:hypothetical protein
MAGLCILDVFPKGLKWGIVSVEEQNGGGNAKSGVGGGCR